MENLFVKNAKYADWQKTHNFDNCKLARKGYGEFLTAYITGENDGFVLNLNGSWGSGKTEFLKRLYSLLLTKHHPVIYIDAWESDFSKEPLTVVTSELLKQLERFNQEIGAHSETQAVKELCGKFLKGSLIGLAGIVSKTLVADAGIGVSIMQQLINEEPKSFLHKLSSDYEEQVNAIKEIRDALGLLAEVLESTFGAELPIVVLVDELDRCRPNYAIEMLEVIKHFFKTDHFVFVVATDTDQLVHSISAIYGLNFDAPQYLKRFFDRKANLPEPNIKNYIESLGFCIESYDYVMLYPQAPYSTLKEFLDSTTSLLFYAYNLKIRDVDQLLHRLSSSLRYAIQIGLKTKKIQVINLPALVVGLIEHDMNFPSFHNRNDRVVEFTPAKNRQPKFLNWIQIDDYIKISMSGVVITKIIEKEDNSVTEIDTVRSTKNTTQISLTTNRRVKCWSDEIDEKEYLYVHQNQIRDDSSKSQSKFWLWSDYKAVIELAGNIE